MTFSLLLQCGFGTSDAAFCLFLHHPEPALSFNLNRALSSLPLTIDVEFLFLPARTTFLTSASYDTF